jgi:hypothetical protein
MTGTLDNINQVSKHLDADYTMVHRMLLTGVLPSTRRGIYYEVQIPELVRALDMPLRTLLAAAKGRKQG